MLLIFSSFHVSSKTGFCFTNTIATNHENLKLLVVLSSKVHCRFAGFSARAELSWSRVAKFENQHARLRFKLLMLQCKAADKFYSNEGKLSMIWNVAKYTKLHIVKLKLNSRVPQCNFHEIMMEIQPNNAFSFCTQYFSRHFFAFIYNNQALRVWHVKFAMVSYKNYSED